MNYAVKKPSTILFAALAMTYVAAVVVVIWMRTAPFIGFETDGVYYMIAARSLFKSAFAPSTYGGGVGMPVAIAAASVLITDTFRAAQLVSALAGLVYLIAAVRLCSKIYSPPIGLATGALLLASPILLINSTSSLTDVLGACLPLAGMWLLSNEESGGWLKSIGAGVLFGAAYTVRSVNFVFFPLPIVLVARGKTRKTLGQLLLVLIGIGIGALPQLYVNQKYFGNAFYSDNWRNTAALVFPWDTVNKLSSFRTALELAGPQLAFVWAKRLVTDLPVALYRVVYLPLLFSIPGICVALKSKTTAHRKLFLTWAICTFGYLVLVAGVWRIESRYFLPVLPFLLSTAVLMWKQLAGNSQKLFFGGVAVAILMSATVAIKDGHNLLQSQSTEFKEAGLFLRDYALQDDTILASQPAVFFYAQRPGVLLGALESEHAKSLDAAVASRNIQWVVFDERRGYADEPSLAWLLDPTSAETSQRGWKSVFVRDSPRIVVWQTHVSQQAAVR